MDSAECKRNFSGDGRIIMWIDLTLRGTILRLFQSRDIQLIHKKHSRRPAKRTLSYMLFDVRRIIQRIGGGGGGGQRTTDSPNF